MKNFLVLCIHCFVFLCLLVECLNASIRLEGLEHNSDLSDYINEVVLLPHKAKSEKSARFSKVKADTIKALKAKGYYDSRVTVKENTDTIIFHVESGPQYTINHIKVIGIEDQDASPLQIHDGLLAQSVLDAQRQILNRIAKTQCIYKPSVRHEILLDHDNHTAGVRFIVVGSKGARFGVTEFNGSETIKRKYLSRFLAYTDGECWTARKIEKTRTSLLETGLLSSVDVNVPDTLPESKHVPVRLVLKENVPEKIRLGIRYSTWEGTGTSVEWQHKNYFGSGEKVSATANVSTFLQSLGLDLTKPFFLSEAQSLNASVLAKRQDTDAFEEASFNIQGSIIRTLSKHWSINVGTVFEISTIEEGSGDKDTVGLVSFPARFNFDNRDNPLDSHEGYRLGFRIEPFADAFGKLNPFFKSRITYTTYFDMGDSSFDPVLALRVSTGSILGPEADDILASKRFYAGGGGSIRGFGFQEAGPVDADNKPSGGRSIVEATAELRFKFIDTIGGVAFVDAGRVYDEIVPDFEGSLFVGAGAGIRYYTSFGPIRFDVATPVNKRDFADQDFQVYISIGQAF